MEKQKRRNLLKWVLGIIGGLVGLVVAGIISLTLIFTHDQRVAKDPDKILSKAHVKLPAYEVVYQDDNMDRDASAWSEYEWRLKLKEPLDEKDMSRLDKKVADDENWSYDEGESCYVFNSNDNDRGILIYIFVENGEVHMQYMWYDFLF